MRRTTLSRLGIASRGFGYTLFFLSLWTLAAWTCRPLDRHIPLSIPKAARGFGIVLIIAGITLCVITAANFVVIGRGTPAIFDPPKEFVSQGPNRFVRNPMYIGYVSGLLGLGLYCQSAAILLFSLVVFALIHLFVVFAEEPGLHRRFGPQYDNYCRAVPRWLPRLTPTKLPI